MATTGNNQRFELLRSLQGSVPLSPNGDEDSVTQVYWGNPDLTWRFPTTSMQVSTCITLIDAQLNLNAEYFHKKTSDMLYDIRSRRRPAFPASLWNIMTMINKGLSSRSAPFLWGQKNTSLEVILTRNDLIPTP